MRALARAESVLNIGTVWLRHPSEDALEDYTLLRLSEIESASLEAHLLACDSCQAALQEIDRFILAMRQIALASEPSTLAGENRPRQLPVEALVSRWARLQGWPRSWPRSCRRRWLSFTPGRAALAGVTALLCLVTVFHRPPAPSRPPAAVTLTAFRGDPAHSATAPAGRALALAIDSADIPASTQCRVEVVNATGRTVWSGVATAAEGQLNLTMREALGAGIYWIRLYAGGSAPVREFGLRLD
jgi:anti-sigma factor RsiW